MKSSNEMYESLLLRRNEYVKSQTKRRKVYALTAVAFALILLVGAGLWFMRPKGTEKTVQTENTGKDNTVNNEKVTSLADEPWHVWIGSLQFVDMTAYNTYDSATDDTELHLWFGRFPKDRTNVTDDTAWNEYLRTSAQDEAEYLRNYCISVTVKADTKMINGYYFECDITKEAFDRLALKSDFTFMVRSLDTDKAATDRLGVIIIDGTEYHETGWGNPEGYTKKDCLGLASEFDGNYKSGDMAYDGEVYTVNETDDILLLYTDNDGIVVLKDANSETTFIDQIGMIIKDGREYRQIFSDNTDSYTKKDCIGRASEFDGTYSGTPDVDGDVYTVNEAEDVLVIHLDNGGMVYLRCAE